jgi:hypothetical protein
MQGINVNSVQMNPHRDNDIFMVTTKTSSRTSETQKRMYGPNGIVTKLSTNAHLVLFAVEEFEHGKHIYYC